MPCGHTDRQRAFLFFATADTAITGAGDSEKCRRRIFWGTLEYYLQDMDEEARNAAMLKIQAAGWLRFLKILVIEQADIRTELKELQIRHAAEHLADLVFRIDSLAI